MKKTLSAFLFSSGLFLTPMIGLANPEGEALKKTVDLLQNPKERDAAIKGNSAAEKADAFAKKVGGQNTEKIYQLSAGLFEKLVQKYGADTDKINEVLKRALKDPSGFANSEFSPEDIKALRDLAGQLDPAGPENK